MPVGPLELLDEELLDDELLDDEDESWQGQTCPSRKIAHFLP